MITVFRIMDEPRASDSNKEMNEHLLGSKKTNLLDRILLSPYMKFLLPSILVAFVVPATVYGLMVNPYIVESSYSVATCNLKPEYRVDCFPGKITTRKECTEALCCWNEALSLCYHTVPAQHGYTPSGGVYYEGATFAPRESNSPLGSPNLEELYLDIKAVDGNHVEISLAKSSQVSSRKRRELKASLRRESDVKYEDLDEEDEVTQKLLYFLPRDRRRRTVEIELEGSPNLNAYVHYPEFSVTLAREDFPTNEASSIFSTARGPLILTERYWEWTLFLTTGSLYGMNDLEVNGTTNSIYNNENGTIIPAFLAISPTGEGAAYYIDYEGPLEVQVLNVSNLVILRGMALPENLAIHVFAGPTPLEAVQQLTSALTSASQPPFSIPPSYNYGLHVCPNGVLNSVPEAVLELNQTIESLASLLAPWDSHCLHEQLASVLNHFLTTEDLEFVNTAKSFLEYTGRRFLPHLSPMILADQGTLLTGLEESALLLKNGSTSYTGIYQNESVVYPDWNSPEVKTLASSYLKDYLRDTGSPGSVWIRDAWPKDESNSSQRSEVDFSGFDYMPETLEQLMNTFTVPYNLSTTSEQSHHVTHNSYSQEFRTFVRSSTKTIEFLGPPGEGGNTTWSGLRRSVRSAVGAGIMGQLPPPIYICGTSEFNTSIHDELCIRWYQAAVTWPYVIVLPDRLPGGSNLSTSASLRVIKALRLRASLASYQHTLIAGFFQRGTPVLAPTSLHYPEDNSFTRTHDQFMWGEAILVGLVTLPGVFQVPMRLPGDISWRHLMGGAEAVPVSNGTTPVTATVGQIITLVRPGHVVPIHKEVSETTSETMLRNVTLSVNMNCNIEKSCPASGEIYYGSESGEFLKILINATHLSLGNINGVKMYACSETQELTQATFIQTVELLGNSSYEVDVELCNIMENNVVISLA